MPNVPHITQNFARPSYRPDAPSGLDPDMRRMAVVAAGLGAGLALVIGAFSLSHQVHRGGVPVIEPMPGPVRVKPLDPGGMKVAGTEDVVTGAEQLSPPSEAPEIASLHARTRARKPAQPASARIAEAPPAIAPAPVVQKAVASQVVPVAAAELHGIAVQIGAFDSEQAAAQDWGKSAEKMPKLFDGHTPQVARAQAAGRVVYRLRTGGFATPDAAAAFCAKVRDRGGDCSVAAF
jgi:hypothetical protein